MVTENDKLRLIQFLDKLDADITTHLSANMAISLYDILCEFYLDEGRIELRLAEFFSGMPDKLQLVYHVLGSIGILRLEVANGKDKEKAKIFADIISGYFNERSRKLNEEWR